jgi:DNA-binding XRE family transcriptional regulator
MATTTKFKQVTVGGRKYALVPLATLRRLTAATAGAAVPLPPLPPADAGGNRPAVAFARASIARRIIQRRTAASLSQIELARRAGIRPETLNRIEKAKVTADTATLTKIDAALTAAGAAN